jgi:hypothetical protein
MMKTSLELVECQRYSEWLVMKVELNKAKREAVLAETSLSRLRMD